MNAEEREFLDASQHAQMRAEEEREAQRKRELVAAQNLAEEKSRAAQKLRQRAILLAIALIIVALLAASSAILGQQANQNATRARMSDALPLCANVLTRWAIWRLTPRAAFCSHCKP